MRHRLSTSSSSRLGLAAVSGWRRWPWAALCALSLVVATDRVALRTGSDLWPAIQDSIPWTASTVLERGLVGDELALAELADRAPEQPGLVAMGSSRAKAAFVGDWLPEGMRDRVTFVNLTHGGLGPFELRSWVEDVLPYDPDLVAFYLSEFDTHSPFSHAPYGAALHLSAMRDLRKRVESRYFFSNRTLFLRLGVARLFRGYRYREVLRAGPLANWIEFEIDSPRLGARAPAGRGWSRQESWSASRRTLPPDFPDLMEVVGQAVPKLSAAGRRAQARQVALIRQSSQFSIQSGLLRSTFERLRESGVEVVVIEGEVHPDVTAFVPPETRDEFHRFMAEVERDLGVRFLPAADSPATAAEDFQDITHLGGKAGRRVSQRLGEEAMRALSIPGDSD